MNGNVKFADFQLKKSKLKDGVIEVKYTNVRENNGRMHVASVDEEIESPHHDLLKTIEKFHRFLINSWGLDNEDADFKKDITVTGIDISGKDEMKGIIITGKKTVLSGAVAMNSPRIRFSGGAFGFEEECEKLHDEHVQEIYAALFEGKAAQLQIGFPPLEDLAGDLEAQTGVTKKKK